VISDVIKERMVVMKQQVPEKPALLIIDMVKDTFDEAHHLPITPLAKKIIAPINGLIAGFRKQSWPIVFATDAYNEADFIFKGRMKPHSLAGTVGAEVLDELDRQPEDLWLPKPKFSAFFDTDLNAWLKQREVTLCAVAGVATNFCVLATALDALCCDYKAVLLEDCSATWSTGLHEQILNNYRRNPLDPLLRVLDSRQLADVLGMG
jgi:nicotinamidase/pyrazinamidase